MKKRIRRAILAHLVEKAEARQRELAECKEQFRMDYLAYRATFSFFKGC